MNYNTIYRKYNKISLWIISGLFLIGMLVVQLTMRPHYINMLVISSLFSLVTVIAYGQAWKYLASRSPRVLGKFYLASSTLRILFAFLVLLVYALVVKERTAVISFSVVFMIFYLVLLAFDTIYFSKVEKNNKINYNE